MHEFAKSTDDQASDKFRVVWVYRHKSCYLVATPSPGSIFAYLAMTPKGWHFQVLMGVLIGTVASFLVGWVILKRWPVKEEEAEVEEA